MPTNEPGHARPPEPRILLVDDEPDVLEALALALRRAKEFQAVVDTATSGPSALERVARDKYHVVIADHRMPGMTGVELLHRIGATNPDIVRILITGYADLDVAVDAVDRARVHYYIQKPWSNDELRLTVLEALSGRWKGNL